MARAIITVTEYRPAPGRFTVTCSARRDRRGRLHPADVYGEEAAAAKALEYAIDCRSGYAIVAPAKVSAYIPEDMRSAP